MYYLLFGFWFLDLGRVKIRRLCSDWSSGRGSIQAPRLLIYEESPGRGHCHSLVSLTCRIRAGLGPSECACGPSSRRILGTPALCLVLPLNYYKHSTLGSSCLLETSKKDFSAEVKHMFYSGKQCRWDLQQAFPLWATGIYLFWFQKDDQAACNYSDLWTITKHYRSQSRPKILPTRLALLVSKLRNTMKGLPEPDHFEGRENLVSFSLQEPNNLEVS